MHLLPTKVGLVLWTQLLRFCACLRVQDADGCPEEAGAEGDSPEEVERQRRASVWRASSRPASFTGSALPPMAHSVGQDAAAGTPSATALDRGGSPDPQVSP